MAASGSAIRVMSDPKIEIVAAAPDPDEGLVAPERGGERVAHEGRSIAADGRRTIVRRRSERPAVHSACSVRQNSRTTRAGTAPIRTTTIRHGVLPGPCSTPSASGCARRSAT